jgi:hypothetical protein
VPARELDALIAERGWPFSEAEREAERQRVLDSLIDKRVKKPPKRRPAPLRDSVEVVIPRRTAKEKTRYIRTAMERLAQSGATPENIRQEYEQLTPSRKR